MKKWLLLLSVMIVLVFASAYGLFRVSKSRTFQFFGELVHRVETDEKIVALTFDDAPTERTQEVLDILASQDVKGTFYVIGQDIEKHPDVLKDILEEGHEVGNHSYSHPRFLMKTLAFVKREIDDTNVLIRAAGYKDEITFRPPTGKKLFTLPWYLKQEGMTTVMWNVEPDTYHAGNTEAIVEYTVSNTVPGSIILMHPFCGDACEADREALPIIIEELRADGYRFVTISELLESARVQ